jgi:hypothetical protein
MNGIGIGRAVQVLAASGALLGCGAHAADEQSCSAQDRYTGVVRGQAAIAEVTMSALGYGRVDRVCGSLREGQTRWLDITAAPDRGLAVTAHCDQDCSDIDLALYQGGRRIAHDDAVDDYPVVRTEPGPSSSRYRLQVTMYHCSHEPCRYGVTVFQK